MSFKIAFIGAGSLVFARTLFTDIMSVPELQKAAVRRRSRFMEGPEISIITERRTGRS